MGLLVEKDIFAVLGKCLGVYDVLVRNLLGDFKNESNYFIKEILMLLKV